MYGNSVENTAARWLGAPPNNICGEQGQDTGFVLSVCMCCMSCKVARCNRCDQNVHKVCNVYKLQYVKWSGDLGEMDRRKDLFSLF